MRENDLHTDMADRGQVSISDFQAEGEVFSMKTLLNQEANDMSRGRAAV